MEENIKELEKSNSGDDYYTTEKRKVVDLLIGFFAMVISNLMINILLGFLCDNNFLKGCPKSLIYFNFLIFFTGIAHFFIILIVGIFIAIYFFKIKRRFIGWGIILFIAIPILLYLILWGMCVIAFGI